MTIAKQNVTFVKLQYKFTTLIRYALMVALIASTSVWTQDKADGLTTGAAQTRVSKVRTLENEDVLESLSLDDSAFLENLDGVAFPPGAHTLLLLEAHPSGAATVLVLLPPGGLAPAKEAYGRNEFRNASSPRDPIMTIAKQNVTFVKLQYKFTTLIRYALMVALIASTSVWTQDKADGLTTGAAQTRVSKVRTLENEDVLESLSLDDSPDNLW